jgi:DNA-binding response OmpR family regulator
VLVIESDADYRAVVARCVELAGAQPDPAGSLGQGIRRLDGARMDLVVWGVPAGEPKRAAVVSQLHQAGGCPLVLLDESYEEARASFEAGADQVLPKPFVPGALVGAIKAALRGPGPSSLVPLATRIEIRGALFDSQRRTVSHDGREIDFTKREWELLSFFLANPNQFFSTTELLRAAWQSDQHSPEQLRSYVVRLRRKLGPLDIPCGIESRQGRGYRLAFDGEA